MVNGRFPRLDASVSNRGSLISGRQETARPIVDSPMSQSRADRNESGKVGVLFTQAVLDPTSHAGANKRVAPRMQRQQCSAVGVIGSMKALDETQLIDDSRHMGKQGAGPHSRLSVLAELPGRSQDTSILARLGKGDAGQRDRQWLAVILDQTWLVIKSVDLRWTTVHEEEDHSFRTWSVMGLYRTICKEIRSSQQPFKCQSSETGAAAFQQAPSRNQRNSICSRLTRLNDHVAPQSRYRNSLEASRV